MQIATAVRRIVSLCDSQTAIIDEEQGQTTGRSQIKLEPTMPESETIALENPSVPDPPHSDTQPTEVSAPETSTVAHNNGDINSNSAPASSRRLRRSQTVELLENSAYRPLGGPEYIKVLAKYELFSSDQQQGRVVCRFVDTGNAKTRRPQMIKVEEYSANGGQEFLAQVYIGNPPQSTLHYLLMLT
jgi:hypothetical protein